MMKLNTDHGPQCALPLCRGTAVRHGCTRFRPCGTDPLARLAGSTPLTGLRLCKRVADHRRRPGGGQTAGSAIFMRAVQPSGYREDWPTEVSRF
jgi:hypothetical protein